jgi:hypothetical protein
MQCYFINRPHQAVDFAFSILERKTVDKKMAYSEISSTVKSARVAPPWPRMAYAFRISSLDASYIHTEIVVVSKVRKRIASFRDHMEN